MWRRSHRRHDVKRRFGFPYIAARVVRLRWSSTRTRPARTCWTLVLRSGVGEDPATFANPRHSVPFLRQRLTVRSSSPPERRDPLRASLAINRKTGRVRVPAASQWGRGLAPPLTAAQVVCWGCTSVLRSALFSTAEGGSRRSVYLMVPAITFSPPPHWRGRPLGTASCPFWCAGLGDYLGGQHAGLRHLGGP